MKQEKPKVIAVLGMHRSGTSALSGMLQLLGVNFGSRLIPAIRGVNEKGFFEHEEIVQLHDQLLTSFGLSWMDFRPLPQAWLDSESATVIKQKIAHIINREFSEADIWGLKDPRLCVLLPLWLEIFHEFGCDLKILRIHRAPDEVVQSLNTRDLFQLQSGYLLWLRYVFESHKVSEHLHTVDVTYDLLLKDWRAVIHLISEGFGFDLFPKSSDVLENVESFISSDLKHSNSLIFECDDYARELACHVYTALLSGADIFKYYNQFEEMVCSLSDISGYITKINDLGARYKSCHRELVAEKENAVSQIEYRELLIENIKTRLSDEKNNAQSQIEYRDSLVEDLRKQLRDEKDSARSQVKYRDTLAEELKEQLDDEKNNARSQIEYRDALVEDLKIKFVDEHNCMKEKVESRDLRIRDLQEQIDRFRSSSLIKLVISRIKEKIYDRNNR